MIMTILTFVSITSWCVTAWVWHRRYTVGWNTGYAVGRREAIKQVVVDLHEGTAP